MKKTKVRYQVGDILEVKTFAGPTVYKKVLSITDRTTKWKDETVTRTKGFEGCFLRRKDLLSLKKAHVPYTGREVLKKTISFTYDWQIIRLIKRGV